MNDWRSDWRKQGGVRPGRPSRHARAILATRGPVPRGELIYEIGRLVPPNVAYRVAIKRRDLRRRTYMKHYAISDVTYQREISEEDTIEAGRNQVARTILISLRSNGWIRVENGMVIPTSKFIKQTLEGRKWEDDE